MRTLLSYFRGPVIALCFFFAASAHADETWQKYVSLARFKLICVNVSKQVDLFQRIWEKDPQAQLYGGSSRDLVWFVRGKLAKAHNEAEVEAVVHDLMSRPVDAQEFIVGQSDVDVITDNSLRDIDVDPKFITRLENISPGWFKVGGPRFEQEAKQGYVAVEKIRLGSDGFVTTAGLDHGDGIREIYACRPSAHFDPRITETDFYQNHENHPVLLALRYLRQVAIAYYQRYGQDYPNLERLEGLMDPVSREAVRKVFQTLGEDPASLRPFLDNGQFLRRMNKALGKAFRSYTNPTAAKVLFELFDVDKTLALYGRTLDPYHTLMYRKFRNPADIARQTTQLNEARVPFLSSAHDYFTSHQIAPDADGTFPTFHGTADMDVYRNIVFQGNVASQSGTAGAGVYCVDPRSKQFAHNWRGSNTYVVKLKIDPAAVVVDITEGEGKRAFEAFTALEKPEWFFGGKAAPHPWSDRESAFADFVGADIVRYPYGETFAYVVKNGGAIRGQEGITFPLMTVEQAKADFIQHDYDAKRVAEVFRFDRTLKYYLSYLVAGAPDKARLTIWSQTLGALFNDNHFTVPQLLAMVNDEAWARHPERFGNAISGLVQYFLNYNGSDELGTGLAKIFAAHAEKGDYESDLRRFVDGVRANVPETYHQLLVGTLARGNWGNQRKLLVSLLEKYRNMNRALPMEEEKSAAALGVLRQLAITPDIELSLLALGAMEKTVDHLFGVGVDGNRKRPNPNTSLTRRRAFVRETMDRALEQWPPAEVAPAIHALLARFIVREDDALGAAPRGRRRAKRRF